MRYLLILVVLVSAGEVLYAQNCGNSFVPTTIPNNIGWQKFPDFSLPFTIVYSGPRFGDSQRLPLKKGFSHLATFSGNDASALPASQRAILWYGTATGLNQPWERIESPWGNDMARYRLKWASELRSFANIFDDSRGQAVPKIDILLPDIERHINTTDSILSLKRRNLVAANYTRLSDADFVIRYQRDMATRYAEPLLFTKQSGFTGKISAYSDVPIRNTYLNIDGNSWADWQSNINRLHYLMKDTLTNKVGGDFYNVQSLMTPSAYYFYDYPNPLAGNYLAYLLFQVEANRAWSSKPIVPFVWLRYTDRLNGVKIRPEMAEATAIFPFFSGANGLWLWEDPSPRGPNENWAIYEHFVNGLYRLSLFKDYFSGGTLYIPKSARDHFEDRDPVWRAVIKNGKMLVAAQNPFASETATTNLPIRYGQFETTLTLEGRKVFLCEFSLPANAGNLLDVGIAPNPGTKSLTIKSLLVRPEIIQLNIHSSLGQLVHTESINFNSGNNEKSLDTANLPAGLYVVSLATSTEKIIKKWVKL